MKIDEDKIAAAVVALGCLVLAGVMIIGFLATVIL